MREWSLESEEFSYRSVEPGEDSSEHMNFYIQNEVYYEKL